jgi:pyruvate ferredoxin oxidoreductase beta subunit
VLSPCPRGWRYETEDLVEICKLAVDTCAWPLYEIEDGVYKLNYEPKKKLPIEDLLIKQGRFKHMFEKGSEWMLEESQKFVDKEWEKLLSLVG